MTVKTSYRRARTKPIDSSYGVFEDRVEFLQALYHY